MLIYEDLYIILVICSYNNLNNCVFISTNPERPGDLKESFDVECLDENLVSKYLSNRKRFPCLHSLI